MSVRRTDYCIMLYYIRYFRLSAVFRLSTVHVYVHYVSGSTWHSYCGDSNDAAAVQQAVYVKVRVCASLCVYVCVRLRPSPASPATRGDLTYSPYQICASCNGPPNKPQQPTERTQLHLKNKNPNPNPNLSFYPLPPRADGSIMVVEVLTPT